MTTLGVVFRPQLPPERLRDVVRAAEDSGLDELWLWEDCFLESGIACAAAALAWTDRLRVGIGLLPVPLRNVALTAMEVATLDRLFPDRVHVGVGHGVQEWMAQVGARVDSPLTLLREYLTALRALLRGEEVTVAGRYVRLDGVALDWPPADPPAVHAGAFGRRSLRLCAELADGTILAERSLPADVRAMQRLVDAVAHGTAHPITVYVLAATGPGAHERVEAERERSGLPSGLGVAGDAGEVAEAVRAYAGAGAARVVLLPTADEPDPEGFVRFVALDVRPLLS